MKTTKLAVRLMATTLVLVSLSVVAWAQDEQPPGDGRRTVAQLPANLLRGTVGVFGVENLKPLFVGAAATGVAALMDDAVADALADGSNDFSQTIETGSEPLWSAAAVGVVFIAGRFTDGSRFRAMTYDWLDACLVNAGYTAVLKHAVGRERPNGQNHLSFPSGHTSNAFALAVVAERHYGWKAGVPAYGLASVIALSRLQQNEHYVSDVAAGAALGYIVGRTVVRVNSRSIAPHGARLDVSPVFARRAKGIVLYLSF